jgi:hypothetical protein
MRRRGWWWELLLEPGSGWLRWKGELIEFGGDWYEPPLPGWVFPPVRRAVMGLHCSIRRVFDGRHSEYTIRTAFREAWSLRDPERRRLWE